MIGKYLPAAGIVLAFVVSVLLLRNVSIVGLMIAIAIFCGGCALYHWRMPILAWFNRKVAEWKSDARQLALWTSLAFKRGRDAHDTATMTHQMQFLQGRMMSPMNLFGIAVIAAVVFFGGLGFQEWRINRLKNERDAECSRRELSLNDSGRYQTSRASCAALGATAAIAGEWRDRAIASEARHIRDMADAARERDLAVAAERARRTRTAAVNERARRRQDEQIVSALGGPSPDLDRSLCELAGGVDCGSTGADPDAATPTDSSGVPAGSGNP